MASGDRRQLSIFTGLIEACGAPRAERLGALDGSSLVAALRFAGTAEVLLPLPLPFLALDSFAMSLVLVTLSLIN